MRRDAEGVNDRIAHFASLRPDAPAIHYRDRILSYRELEAASLRLAADLRDKGVGPGAIVGVCIGAGFDLVIAMTAVLRCQAIYLPLDPRHPLAHNESILNESQPCLVVTQRESIGTALPGTCPWFVASERQLNPGCGSIVPEAATWACPPAYMMYTSGTTGKPKAVVLSTDNLRHYLASAQGAFGFDQDDIFCNIARPTFSISLFDLVLPLTVGGAMRLMDRDDLFDLPCLLQNLARSTVLHAGPSFLATLFRYLQTSPGQAEHLTELRHVSTGGDLVLPAVMEGMKEFFPAAELFVIYGTTEISCMGSYFPIPRDRKVEKTLVGKPFPGVGLSLEDGEICFSGPGVGMGYFENAELTAARFRRIGELVAYHTGDYGRVDANGDLEMLGRRDFQVQLRGVRMELMAAENHIVESGFASHCVVTHRNTDEYAGYLVAFMAGARCRDPEVVKQALRAKFPAEMVPSRFVFLDALPTTFNGKLDRRRLHEWPLAAPVSAREPGTATEEAIGEILGARLGLPMLGPADNFFASGGQSLLAILILDDLEKKLALTVPPAVFFAGPTPRELARFADTAAGEPPRPKACHVVPLTARAGQRPLFCIAAMHAYNALAQSLGPAWSPFGVFTEAECKPSEMELTTLEDLARTYAEAILAQQPRGPYYLLGYSFGGILAFEVGRQLRAAGHRVKRIFLLDAYLPENPIQRWKRTIRIGRILLTTNPVVVLSSLRDRRHSTAISSKPDPRTWHFERDRGKRNRAIVEGYVKRIPKYRGKVTLFIAGGRMGAAWRPYISQLKLVRTAGDHFTLIENPACLRKIARVIDRG